METTTKLKWDINLPVSYWLKLAQFQSLADEVYTCWSDNPSLNFSISCNDHFVPAADGERVNPEDVDELLEIVRNNPFGREHKQYDAVMAWVAKRRGYPDANHWRKNMKIVEEKV